MWYNQSNTKKRIGGIHMARTFKDSFSGFGREVLERIREDNYARIGQDAFEESIIGIKKAVAALCEAKVDDKKIISLLQKYWDLRLSEAEEFLRHEKWHQEQ